MHIILITTKGKGSSNSKWNANKNENNKKKDGNKKFKGECFYRKKKGYTIVKCRAKIYSLLKRIGALEKKLWVKLLVKPFF